MAEPIPISIPRDTVNDDSVQILAWKVLSGTPVEKDQLICEVETSKAVLEIHAPESGIVTYAAAEGAEVPVGATICTIFPASMEREAIPHAPSAPAADIGTARLSASARKTASDLGIDTSSFPPGMLVRQADVLQKAGKGPPSQGNPETVATGVPIRWEELPRRKVLEGRILQQGRALSVRSSVTTICRATALLARLKELGVAAGTIQPAIIYEAARLLHKYPMFNACFDRGRLGIYEQVNVGWALDGGQGLVVPVIPEADRKSLREIAACMERQLEAYLEGALTPSDLAGATFTVSDLSGHGASFFDPLIVPGQSAILGVGKGPDYDGQTILHLILAFDHQVTEGKRAAEFLQDLRKRLEVHAALVPTETADEPLPQAEPYCVLCHRDGKTLQRLKLVLLKSEIPPGLVCSLCVAGW